MKVFLLPFLLFSLNAFSDVECQFTLIAPSVVVQLTDNQQVIQRNISLFRGQQSPMGHCYDYKLFFSKGTANSYQRRAYNSSGASIPYNLHQSINLSGILKDYQDAATYGEYLFGASPARHTTYTSPFYISAPGLGTISSPSGVYTDNVRVSIYAITQSSNTYIFDTSITLSILFQITKNIQLSLVDEGGAFDPSSTSRVLDFGLLKQNAEKGADLRVVSNSPYQIKISSQNSGKLKTSAGEAIGYSLHVNSSPVNISNSEASPVSIGNGAATSNSGDRYNLRFKIVENTSNKAAGVYQDFLTITAIAN